MGGTRSTDLCVRRRVGPLGEGERRGSAADDNPRRRPEDAAAPAAPSLQAQVQLLNKYLNDSGKPDQFRVDPDSDDKLIQQVNPANGEVIAEFPASEFAALARSVGISGVVVDKLA